MSFEGCTEVMTKCFNTLHKDPDQRNSTDPQKALEKLLEAIHCQDAELLVAKEVVANQQYSQYFIGACSNFSQQVARVHGPARLECRPAKSKKCVIYTINQQAGHGGWGEAATVAEGDTAAEQPRKLFGKSGLSCLCQKCSLPNT
jgi:hypothetical protein